jgi:hypothetical protein
MSASPRRQSLDPYHRHDRFGDVPAASVGDRRTRAQPSMRSSRSRFCGCAKRTSYGTTTLPPADSYSPWEEESRFPERGRDPRPFRREPPERPLARSARVTTAASSWGTPGPATRFWAVAGPGVEGDAVRGDRSSQVEIRGTAQTARGRSSGPLIDQPRTATTSSTLPMLGRPPLDLGTQPQLRPTATTNDDRPRHLWIARLVFGHRVAMRQAQDLGDLLRVD